MCRVRLYSHDIVLYDVSRGRNANLRALRAVSVRRGAVAGSEAERPRGQARARVFV